MKLDLDAIEKSMEVLKQMGIEYHNIPALLQFAKEAKAALEEAEKIIEIFTMELEVGNKRVWANTANHWLKEHGKVLQNWFDDAKGE